MLYPEICYSGKEKEEGEIKERMSPQDKVERVLKEIHVTFSKSEMVDGHPDKVIIDRKKFLGLLIFLIGKRISMSRHDRAETMRSGRFAKKAM